MEAVKVWGYKAERTGSRCGREQKDEKAVGCLSSSFNFVYNGTKPKSMKCKNNNYVCVCVCIHICTADP